MSACMLHGGANAERYGLGQGVGAAVLWDRHGVRTGVIAVHPGCFSFTAGDILERDAAFDG